jgi:hypothetical protein
MPVPFLNNDRSFWVTWPQVDQILVQKFDSLCSPLTPQLVIGNGYQGGGLAMTVDCNGTVWVTWTGYADGIWGARCASDGTPIETEFRVDDAIISCMHGCPSIACFRDELHVAFCDYRVEGNLNVMVQTLTPNGTLVGGNARIDPDLPSGVQQWSWGSVASNNNLAAYTWVDNRDLRSWDVFYKLERIANDDSEPAVHRTTWRIQPSILKTSSRLTLSLPPALVEMRVSLVDPSGRTIRELFRGRAGGNFILDCGGLTSGVYFVTLERHGRRDSRKLVIQN